MSFVPRCRGCGKTILWRYTPAGNRMPLDPEPVPPAQGTYVIVDKDYCRPSEPMFDGQGTDHHMNHWTTCVKRDEFRPKGSKQ